MSDCNYSNYTEVLFAQPSAKHALTKPPVTFKNLKTNKALITKMYHSQKLYTKQNERMMAFEKIFKQTVPSWKQIDRQMAIKSSQKGKIFSTAINRGLADAKIYQTVNAEDNIILFIASPHQKMM